MRSFGGKAFQADLSLLGEFTDRELEKEYADYKTKYSAEVLRTTVLLLGIIYFLLIIAEHSLIGNDHIFNMLLLNRVIFLTISILFALWLKRNDEPYKHYLGTTIYELTGAVFILSFIFKYKTPTLYVQSPDILLLLLVTYILPNRWIYTAVTGAIISLSFFLLSFKAGILGNTREITLSFIHMVPVVTLLSITSYRSNRYGRIQYAKNKSLAKMSTKDILTDIYNRRGFEEELRRAIKHSCRYGSKLSLALFDIDNFKLINDNYGHLAGDKVLMKFTEIIRSGIRECDFLSRWGGEEFALILPNTGREEAMIMANRLRTEVYNTFISPVGHIACSFGVDSLKAGDNMESLFHRVDNLMYLAKESGKGQVKDTLEQQ